MSVYTAAEHWFPNIGNIGISLLPTVIWVVFLGLIYWILIPYCESGFLKEGLSVSLLGFHRDNPELSGSSYSDPQWWVWNHSDSWTL